MNEFVYNASSFLPAIIQTKKKENELIGYGSYGDVFVSPEDKEQVIKLFKHIVDEYYKKKAIENPEEHVLEIGDCLPNFVREVSCLMALQDCSSSSFSSSSASSSSSDEQQKKIMRGGVTKVKALEFPSLLLVQQNQKQQGKREAEIADLYGRLFMKRYTTNLADWIHEKERKKKLLVLKTNNDREWKTQNELVNKKPSFSFSFNSLSSSKYLPLPPLPPTSSSSSSSSFSSSSSSSCIIQQQQPKKKTSVKQEKDGDCKGGLKKEESEQEQEQKKRIMWEIALTLLKAEARFMLHRDLKPQNILLSINKEEEEITDVVVCDWGLGRFGALSHPKTYSHPNSCSPSPATITIQKKEKQKKKDEECDETERMNDDRKQTNNEFVQGPMSLDVQTITYRSPEIMLGQKEYSAKIDVWSFGLLYCFVFLNKCLFQESEEWSQMMAYFQAFGTPNETSWPTVSSLPHFSPEFPKFKPKSLQEHPFFSNTKKDEMLLDLLQNCLILDPKQRFSFTQVVWHPHFQAFHQIPQISSLNFGVPFPSVTLTEKEYQTRLKNIKRLDVMEFMFLLCKTLRIHLMLFCSAFWLFDRYVCESQQHLEFDLGSHAFLIAAACVWITSKQMEHQPLLLIELMRGFEQVVNPTSSKIIVDPKKGLKDLKISCKEFVYKAQDFIHFERKVLQGVHCHVCVPTDYMFLRQFVLCFYPCKESQGYKKLFASCLIDLIKAMSVWEFRHWKPIHLAYCLCVYHSSSFSFSSSSSLNLLGYKPPHNIQDLTDLFEQTGIFLSSSSFSPSNQTNNKWSLPKCMLTYLDYVYQLDLKK